MPDAPSSNPDPSQDKAEAPGAAREQHEEKKQTSDRADLIALGVGCAVFIIMFIAIVLVGMSGR